MEIRYILIYGTPYRRIKYFEKFKVMTDFILMKSITHYLIFERMKDDIELEKTLFGE